MATKKAEKLKKDKEAKAKKAAEKKAVAKKKADLAKKPKEHPKEVMEQDFSDNLPSGFSESKKYMVRPGCAITSRRGVLTGGMAVKSKIFRGRSKHFKNSC